jgi:hypothetical protein
MRLPIGRVASIIAKGANIQHEEKQERRAWDMWVSLYPHMIVPAAMASKPAVEFKPYSEFYQAIKKPLAPRKTKEEILKDVDIIRAMARSSKE